MRPLKSGIESTSKKTLKMLSASYMFSSNIKQNGSSPVAPLIHSYKHYALSARLSFQFALPAM